MENPNRDQIEGRTDKAAGEVKEVVGQATGDEGLEREGTREKAAGEDQQQRGDIKSEVADEVTEQLRRDKLRDAMK